MPRPGPHAPEPAYEAEPQRPASPDRVAIVGAGSLGLTLATALHASGVEVHLLARPGSDRAGELAGGFRRTGIFGDHAVGAGDVHVADSVESLTALDPDATLVCTKTTASPALAEPLGRALSATARPSPLVVCHNGWGSAERFAAHLAPERVFSARVITGMHRPSLDTVEVTVHAAPIHMGSLFGADPAALAGLARAIDRGGLPCATSSEIRSDLLAKLLYNGLLNPLGALVGTAYGELGDRPTTRAIMVGVAHEIFAVFGAAGLRTDWPDAESYLETFFGELLPPTRAHESSMLQDLRAGRPTEIDSISGAVCALGAEHGVATPIHEALTMLLHAAEGRRHDSR